MISLQTHCKGYRPKNAEYGLFSDSFMPTEPLNLSLSRNRNDAQGFYYVLFFFYFQFIVSLKNVAKSVNYRVSFLLDCVQRALKYLGLNPPLQNYFNLEKAPPRNSSSSCLWSNIRSFSS